jgi:tetratricopeptide (TPR) repeat protein
MVRSDFPTKDADAFSNFVQGRACFQSYLGTGKGEELTQARDRFQSAAVQDPEFDIAKLYLAVTLTELRDSDAAIVSLTDLVERRRYLPEAYIQLAYAHIKQYGDADYEAADKDLNEAVRASEEEKRNDLLDLIAAYRVFLFAVRGGRGTESLKQRLDYLRHALSLGQTLLHANLSGTKSPEAKTAVQFEVDNAMGIAYMWLGELLSPERDPNAPWDRAETYFNMAVALRPSSVRTLQNLGLLCMLRGDYAGSVSEEAQTFYKVAEEFVARSLKLNGFDQYPFYQMALLSIRTGDWEAAEHYLETGRKQKGAVRAYNWETVAKSIRSKNPALAMALR